MAESWADEPVVDESKPKMQKQTEPAQVAATAAPTLYIQPFCTPSGLVVYDGLSYPWPAPGYLSASTAEAAANCFCSQCNRYFATNRAVLQHFRDALAHRASIEQHEAAGYLYLEEACAAAAAYEQQCAAYYGQSAAAGDSDAYLGSVAPVTVASGNPKAAPAAEASCDASSSKATSAVEAPVTPPPRSEVAAAGPSTAAATNEVGANGKGRRGQGAAGAKKGANGSSNANGSKGKQQQQAQQEKGQKDKEGQKDKQQKQSKAPAQPKQQKQGGKKAAAAAKEETYDSAFPPLGPTESSSAAPATPKWRFIPAATRKLRADAPVWPIAASDADAQAVVVAVDADAPAQSEEPKAEAAVVAEEQTRKEAAAAEPAGEEVVAEAPAVAVA